MTKDYYEVLNVPKTATKVEIKKQYRLLAKKYHPDISKEVDAETLFMEISEAYEVLSDEQKRSNYDQVGHERFKYQQNSGQHSSWFQGREYYGNFKTVAWYWQILIVAAIIAVGIFALSIWIIFLIMRTIVRIINNLLGGN